MEFTFWVAAVHLPGSVQTQVFNSMADIVYIGDGDYYFENEARHLSTWCTENNLRYYLVSMKGTLPQEVL